MNQSFELRKVLNSFRKWFPNFYLLFESCLGKLVNIFPCGICTNEVENDDHSVQNHTECVNISSLNYQNSLTSKDLKYVLTGLSSHTIVNLDQKQTDSKKTKKLKKCKEINDLFR